MHIIHKYSKRITCVCKYYTSKISIFTLVKAFKYIPFQRNTFLKGHSQLSTEKEIVHVKWYGAEILYSAYVCSLIFRRKIIKSKARRPDILNTDLHSKTD